MNKKHVIISLLITFVMLFTTFAVSVGEVDAAVNKNTYWIKVNTKCNVVTVYKKSGGEYKPLRAMVCSTGKKGHATPKGTYRMGTKIGWCYLVGNVWGPFSMVIKGNYLFHTVPYSKKSTSSMKYKEYNKLGTSCSHGCVRLAYIDAKWLWNNCPKGTKITVYSNSKPGPLGKPTPIKMKKGWKYDPTDPNKKNKHFLLKKPVIEFSSKKPTTIELGESFSIKSGVTAKNVNAYQDLTSKLKYTIYKYDSNNKKYVQVKSLSTKKVAKYKIRYRVYDYYCGGTGYKNFYLKVTEPEDITIAADDRTVEVGSVDAVNAMIGVSALQKDKDRTDMLTVSIVKPNSDTTITLNNDKAKEFIFDTVGTYKITYKLSNTIYPYKISSKTIYVTCIPKQIIEEEKPGIDEELKGNEIADDEML